MPLIRYAVGDRGGVSSYQSVYDAAAQQGHDLGSLAKSANVPLLQLPFVYVYERADLSTKLYGAIIYPEYVREALQEEALLEHITGKFTLQTLTDEKQDQVLELNVELREKRHSDTALAARIQEVVVENLLKRSSEYKNNHMSLGARVAPKVVFWPHEDPKFFKPNIKQKWVIK
jgi:phenylacetate-CoA ligase